MRSYELGFTRSPGLILRAAGRSAPHGEILTRRYALIPVRTPRVRGGTRRPPMSHPSERDVLDALRPIQDPDFKRSIVDLGFVKNLRIDGGKVSFAIELTTPACPVKERFEGEARAAVLKLAGA